jgi:UDP-glucose 4-epimerase
MRSAWIIGSGGLLGSAITRNVLNFSTDVFRPSTPFSWSDPDALLTTVAAGVREFGDYATRCARWEIYWAAGVGSIGSSQDQLEFETRALRVLLSEVARNEVLGARSGSVVFASSAGALYAGSTDERVSESSALAPTTPYAFAKLEQERLLEEFSRAPPAHRVLIARISTLFGPRGPARPAKGLFAIMARSMFSLEPVRIFVPLDTMRDYIYSDDAAKSVVDIVRADSGVEPLCTKIVASQTNTTIAEIVGHFTRVAHRHPRIITGATALTSKYGGRITFRSRVGPNTAEKYKSAMHVCISRILETERVSYVSRH